MAMAEEQREQETIGRLIRQARVRAELTPTELAARIGKSLNTVYHIENGNRGVSVAALKVIAKAIGIRVHDILGDTPPEEQGERRQSTARSFLLELPAYEQRRIEQYIEVLLSELKEVERRVMPEVGQGDCGHA